jgi:hypothetical protein
MITWLRIAYECQGTSSLIDPLLGSAGLANKIAGIDPNDAMLVNPFVPDLSAVLPLHLIEPVLVPVVYNLIRFMEELNLTVSVCFIWFGGIKTPLDLHIDSMEQDTLPGDEFNEAIKDEELRVEDLGEPHEARWGECLKVNILGSLTNSEREAMVSSSIQIIGLWWWTSQSLWQQ